MQSRNWHLGSSAIALCALASPSYAQEKSPSPPATQPTGTNRSSDSAPAADTQSNSEIIVTAQRRAEIARDVPISISALPGRTLDKSTFQGVTEALSTVPGTSAFKWGQSSGTIIAIRGVTAAFPLFGGSSPIAYYLDGIPFGLVDSAIAPDAGTYDLSRVEVLRGPQGTLYGASALNGVVRVITGDADPNSFDFKARGSLSSTKGGGENYRGDAALNLPLIDEKLAARFVVGYENDDGWIDSAVGKKINDARLQNYRLKIKAKPNDRLTIGLSGWISRQKYGAPSVSNSKGDTNATLAQPISTNYNAYGFHVGYDFGSFTADGQTSYLTYRNNDIVDFFDFTLFHLDLHERYRSRVFSQELNLASTDDGPWKWTVGAIYRQGKSFVFQTIPGIATLDWSQKSGSFAVYGELTRSFGNTLDLTAGGRYFQDTVTTAEGKAVAPLNGVGYYRDSARFHAVTPRVVLRWKPQRGTMLYASYSQGFRSGAPQAYYITGGVAGFPPVRPDRLHNFEIGAKSDLWGGLVSFDLAAYYMKWNDIQQQLIVPFQNLTVTAIVNGQSASGPGLDASVTLRPARGMDISGAFSWNNLTIDRPVVSGGQVLFAKGDRLNFSAKYIASFSGNYSFPISKNLRARLSASASYSSPLTLRLAGPVVIKRGDNLFIARASAGIGLGSAWELSLYGDNLTNERGAVTRNPGAIVPVPSTDVRIRPRTVGLQLEYRLK